jgi:hypothetical protein
MHVCGRVLFCHWSMYRLGPLNIVLFLLASRTGPKSSRVAFRDTVWPTELAHNYTGWTTNIFPRSLCDCTEAVNK